MSLSRNPLVGHKYMSFYIAISIYVDIFTRKSIDKQFIDK